MLCMEGSLGNLWVDYMHWSTRQAVGFCQHVARNPEVRWDTVNTALYTCSIRTMWLVPSASILGIPLPHAQLCCTIGRKPLVTSSFVPCAMPQDSHFTSVDFDTQAAAAGVINQPSSAPDPVNDSRFWPPGHHPFTSVKLQLLRRSQPVTDRSFVHKRVQGLHFSFAISYSGPQDSLISNN